MKPSFHTLSSKLVRVPALATLCALWGENCQRLSIIGKREADAVPTRVSVVGESMVQTAEVVGKKRNRGRLLSAKQVAFATGKIPLVWEQIPSAHEEHTRNTISVGPRACQKQSEKCPPAARTQITSTSSS